MKPLLKINTSKRHRRRPRILICTPEITELPEGMGNAANYIRAKGGGMGDISAGLIRYLYEDGRFQLPVALPKYDTQIRDLAQIGSREIAVLARILDRKGIHLVADSAFSHIDDVYGDTTGPPRLHRSEAFQRHVINHLLGVLEPDVVHCNDWMTGLVPPAAREKGIKSLFTLHNIFTEKETPWSIDFSGIDVRRFMKNLYFEKWPEDSLQNWIQNPVDFAASGIHAADLVNTVSNNFLKEIVRGDFADIVPASIRGTLQAKYKEDRAFGILNAPNDTVDPRISIHITPYDVEDVMEMKRINKRQFQEAMALNAEPNAPLFFWASRLYPQKGPELLYKIAMRCVDRHGIQIALVANGDPATERLFQSLAKISRGHIAHAPFREDLSELGKAASDFVLMPSRYEPCGLPQMECPRFGTLAVVRSTGGLKDTVFELDAEAGKGNGFIFEDFMPKALEEAIVRAVAFYQMPEEIRSRNIKRIMRESFENFSLEATAQKYISLYESLIPMR